MKLSGDEKVPREVSKSVVALEHQQSKEQKLKIDIENGQPALKFLGLMDEHEIVDLLAEFLLHPYLFVAYFWPNLLIGEDTVVSIEEIAVIIVLDEKNPYMGNGLCSFCF